MGIKSICILLSIWTLILTSDSLEVMNCTEEEDCVVQIPVPEGRIIVLECTKAGADFLFFRDGKISERNQDPSFRKRVKLMEPQPQSGAFSVTLKKAKLDEAGVYSCEGLVQTSAGKRETFKGTVELRVSEKSAPVASALKSLEKSARSLNNEDAKVTPLGLIVGLTVGFIVMLGVIAVVAFVLWKSKAIKKWQSKRKPCSEPNTPTSNGPESSPCITDISSLTNLL